MLNRRFKKSRCRMPLDLQFFAEPAGGGGAGNGAADPSGQLQGQNGQQGNPPPVGQQNPAAGQQAAQIDYAKIQQMLEGTLAAKEDTALKAYFKQQGLSQQEAEQAMAAFKAEKAKNQPDTAAIQSQLTQAQAAAQEAQIQSAATLTAVSLGIDAKTIPYVLKMADLSLAMGQDGKINDEAVKNALNKVLEDIPALKPQAQNVSGFQIGAPGGGQQSTPNEDALKKAFGL